MDAPLRINLPSRRASNSLGIAGLIVAVLGAALFTATIGWVEWIQGDKRGQQGEGLLLIGQGLLLLAGCVAGGVANLVSLGLSAAGLFRHPRWPAATGLALSFLGPTLVVGWWVLIVESRV